MKNEVAMDEDFDYKDRMKVLKQMQPRLELVVSNHDAKNTTETKNKQWENGVRETSNFRLWSHMLW